MAYEEMESSFSCVCGAGKIVAAWSEHDTWPSPNKHYTWHFECSLCESEYEFYTPLYGNHIVRKIDADKHRAMLMDCENASRKTLDIAAKYRQQWVDYVVSLPSQTARHHAIGNSSYGTFLKRVKSPGWLEAEASSTFQVNPGKCLKQVRIHDMAVTESEAAAEALEKAAYDFWTEIDKKTLPLK
jgi:hypothetical protein